MAARSWTALLGIPLVALALPACGGAFAHTPAVGAAGRVPLAPAGVYVEDDVADGYVAYGSALAPSGKWEADATYGVHWCPAASFATPFRPYVSNGHWATSDSSEHGAPPGYVYWADDGRAAWTSITTHHGWWIDLGGSDWCWVPGATETPARVVWRSSDEFVGWAPEPPSWVDDGDDDDSAGFEWAFELLGTLLEDVVDGYTLGGDAAKTARARTAPSHGEGSHSTFSSRPPAKPAVVAARGELVKYLHDHESARASADTGATSGHSTTSPTTTTSSTSTTATTSTSSSTSHDDSDDARVDVVVEHLPPGPMLMTMLPEDLGASAFGRTEGGGVGSHGENGGSMSGSAMAQNATAKRATEHAVKRATESAMTRATSRGSYHTHSSGSSGSSRSSSSGSSSSHHR